MNAPETLPASSTFEAFLSQGLDRCAFITSWLRAREVPHTVVVLAGRRHIVVRFAQDAYDPRFRMKTLVAHYDRAESTPGANDNSAACFQLMLFAERLASGTFRASAHNIRIFFTDGEESAGTRGIAGQGAYALGSGLRKLKMTEDDVFVFDACGRGDTLVLSTAGMDRKTGRLLSARLADLNERAGSLARESSPDAWLRLPTPYSDNAGFLAAGIPSQVITVLPHDEAASLLDTAGSAEKTAGLTENIARYQSLPAGSPEAAAIPETWKMLHSERDSAATLTASSFSLIARFLDAIAQRQELAP